MRTKAILTALLFACLILPASLQAQMKVGFTNLELILNYMPEMKQVDQQVETYGKKLEEQLTIKQQALQSKYLQYEEMVKANKLTPAERQKMEQEIMKMNSELEQEAQQAEYKILEKKAELLQPVELKLNAVIKEVAQENGFDYIINQTSGENSIPQILFSQKENDVTDKIVAKLGIKLGE